MIVTPGSNESETILIPAGTETDVKALFLNALLLILVTPLGIVNDPEKELSINIS